MAEKALMKLGIPVVGDPRDVLLAAVHQAHGMRLAASDLASRIDPEDLLPNDNESFKDGTPRRIQAMSVLDLLADWTDKSARMSKLALDAGIEERFVRLAERQGEAVVEAIRAVILGLALDEGQTKLAFQLAAKALRGLTETVPQMARVVSEE